MDITFILIKRQELKTEMTYAFARGEEPDEKTMERLINVFEAHAIGNLRTAVEHHGGAVVLRKKKTAKPRLK